LRFWRKLSISLIWGKFPTLAKADDIQNLSKLLQTTQKVSSLDVPR
jgi:hypothetical protein